MAAGNSFEKIQHSIFLKTPGKSGVERNFLNQLKGTHAKPTLKSNLVMRYLNFFLRSETRL